MSEPGTTKRCIGNDPGCPCQDGDACHYVDMPGSPAMKPKPTADGWVRQHYGRDDRYAYSGLDLARGPDRTAWRCFCGKSGVVSDEPVPCDQWGCPAKEFLQ